MTLPRPDDQPSFGRPALGQDEPKPQRAGLDFLLDDAALRRFSAESRVEHAVADRARERWLRQLADDELDLLSVLVNLAERAEPVRLVASGGQHRGVIRTVGIDHLCLMTDANVLVVVPLRAVGAVFAGGIRPAGRTPVPDGPLLGEALCRLAGERPWVHVRVAGLDQPVGGVLELATTDLVLLRTDGPTLGGVGPARETAYVPLSSVVELLLNVSG